MTENPWKTRKETTIYQNPWIRLEEHQVLNPAGKEGIYGKVHFKNKAMAIIPIDREGNTWLVGQYRYTLNQYSWEIPMGGGPIGQDFLESAKRELKEETGLTASKWTELLRIHTSNSVTDEEGIIYLAEDLTEGETEFEETEILQIQKLPFAKVIDKVMKGEITDSISIAGILKAARVLGF
ncbi:NUDIX domain-containing protein [Algoriphagus hitonicola]|uniref:GDP-mannose pyrophosphatase n=1 Tax=Algoriphagus hitonicola TaxID=435880 RepID=A0A1I2XHV9_9BACT|nr:NUDIX hydrolase [Algoriphagus hitonicola]SFH12286.1 8-oxo-dGTP pyrophosphatase MutT, NUDIX family [Algoriphagus hitonicola]